MLSYMAFLGNTSIINLAINMILVACTFLNALSVILHFPP